MKEILAFIRINKVNATKAALAGEGFPAFFCRPCLGRGKKSLAAEALRYVLNEGELPADRAGEAIAESFRLIPKRIFTVIVEDGQAAKAVKAIIRANQTGSRGDGRIFVLPVDETYVIRTGENTL